MFPKTKTDVIIFSLKHRGWNPEYAPAAAPVILDPLVPPSIEKGIELIQSEELMHVG
jgi:hypothetical protein